MLNLFLIELTFFSSNLENERSGRLLSTKVRQIHRDTNRYIDCWNEKESKSCKRTDKRIWELWNTEYHVIFIKGKQAQLRGK